MSAEYRVILPSPWEELVQFLAGENEWTPERVMHCATALGILLLSDYTRMPGSNMGREFPNEILLHLAGEMIDRAWELIGVNYALAGERGELD